MTRGATGPLFLYEERLFLPSRNALLAGVMTADLGEEWGGWTVEDLFQLRRSQLGDLCGNRSSADDVLASSLGGEVGGKGREDRRASFTTLPGEPLSAVELRLDDFQLTRTTFRTMPSQILPTPPHRSGLEAEKNGEKNAGTRPRPVQSFWSCFGLKAAREATAQGSLQLVSLPRNPETPRLIL